MLAALGLLALTFQGHTVNLFRGAAVAVPRYWDVEDTYLDPKDPDSSLGGQYTLEAGPGRPVLIRFGDLNRVVGPNARVVKATLFLTPTGGDQAVLHSAARVLAPWGEGPMFTIGSAFMPNLKKSPTEKPALPKWAATYKQRRSGFDTWHSPGAAGAQDTSPIAGATLETVGKEIAIHGLDSAVQDMIARPYENNGFALSFDSSPEFNSSQSPDGKPRLEIQFEDVPSAGGSDLSVTLVETSPQSPKAGEEVTYTGHVKNIGDQPSKPFSIAWIVGEKSMSTSDVTTAIAPGAESTFTFRKRFEESATDHRTHPVGLRLSPSGAEATLANKSVEIDENAIPIDVVVRPEAASAISSASNSAGSHGLEDWVQAQARLWNETYAPQSRFSFAPEGALERIRIASISIGTGSGGAVAESPDVVSFERSLSRAAGLLDLSKEGGFVEKVQVLGSSSRSHTDLFPGLMGFGDTRWEGGLPGALPIAYDPVFDPNVLGSYLEPTDLLSATDVGALNRYLGKKERKPSDVLLPISKAIILSVLDLTGRVLPNTDLLFFQSEHGAFPSEQPAFAVRTNNSGVVILSSRGEAGPFGDLDPDGGNSTFLVQAKTNGVLETGWLEAWQLTDSAHRGTLTSQLRLNLPDTPIDTSTNLALDRSLSDSAGDPPAKLGALIDDAEDTEAPLPDAPGSWVEIDLGRDRTIGEIDLVTSGKPFWSRFDILAYSTGQRVDDAFPIAHELDWGWTLRNRRDPGKLPTTSQIAYRGGAQRVRYLRIVNGSGGPGTLAELRILGARISQ